MTPAPTNSSSLAAWLAQRLQDPLPAWRAQRAFQPEMGFGRYFAPSPHDARRAAVLVLLYPRGGAWHVPLTLRPLSVTDHAGQISLPGGVIEPDESSADAALRELHEELGVVTSEIQLLGPLSKIYLYRSHFEIAPWLAVAQQTPQWQPNPEEVAELLEVPIGHFLLPESRTVLSRQAYGVEFAAPALDWQGHSIWGATSLILVELLALWDEWRAAPAASLAAR